MSKELTPLQAFEQHKERFYHCAEEIMHRDFPFTKNNSYQEVMSEDVKNELAIIETALKNYDELKSQLCEYFGLDDLFPYDNSKEIIKRLKELNEEQNKTKLDLLGKLNKLRKALDIIKSYADFKVYEMQDSYFLSTGNNYRSQKKITKEEYEPLKEILK